MVCRRRFQLEELEMEDEVIVCMWISLLCIAAGMAPAVAPLATYFFESIRQLTLPPRAWRTGHETVRCSAFALAWQQSESYAMIMVHVACLRMLE